VTTALLNNDGPVVERIAKVWNTTWDLTPDLDIKRFPSSGPYTLDSVTDEGAVARLMAFARTWDGARPILIHCWAGVSRSTASAFAIACERSPGVDERRIALALRRAAPHAYPNRRIVGLADSLLGRRGRMLAAVEAMGDYNDLAAGPFDFPVRHA